MKLGSVTKLDKRNTETSKKLTMTLCLQIVALLPFFRFMVNLEQSGSLILVTCKTYIFINGNLLFYENWKQN